MMTSDILTKLVPAFFVTSSVPGLCMTLALSLGMAVGVKRTIWMMIGVLTGMSIVVSCDIILGADQYFHNHQQLFYFLKVFGAIYLCFIAIKMWKQSGSTIAIHNIDKKNVKRASLLMQGLITALSNPKLWIFMVSLIPPFINIKAMFP